MKRRYYCEGECRQEAIVCYEVGFVEGLYLHLSPSYGKNNREFVEAVFDKFLSKFSKFKRIVRRNKLGLYVPLFHRGRWGSGTAPIKQNIANHDAVTHIVLGFAKFQKRIEKILDGKPVSGWTVDDFLTALDHSNNTSKNMRSKLLIANSRNLATLPHSIYNYGNPYTADMLRLKPNTTIIVPKWMSLSEQNIQYLKSKGATKIIFK